MLGVSLAFPVRLAAQSSPSFVISAAYVNGDTTKPAVAVFARNDATGTLTPVSGSPFVVRDLPTSLVLDVQGRFLFGACSGDHVCMYTFDKVAGTVAEVPKSPFAADTTDAPVFVAVESTGQFLLVVNSKFPSPMGPYASSVDAFQIDVGNLGLVPYQNLFNEHNYAAAAADPRNHALYVYFGEIPAMLSDLELDWFSFDSDTGLLVQKSTSAVGSGARSLAVDPQGRYLVAGHGQQIGFFETYLISASDGSLTPVDNTTTIGTNTYPYDMAVDNSGQWLYIGTGYGVLLYEVSSLPDGPPSSVNNFFSTSDWTVDPTGSFFAIPGNGINIYAVDPTTGLLAANPIAGSPFAAGSAIAPFFYTRSSNQQPVPVPRFRWRPPPFPLARSRWVRAARRLV